MTKESENFLNEQEHDYLMLFFNCIVECIMWFLIAQSNVLCDFFPTPNPIFFFLKGGKEKNVWKWFFKDNLYEKI